MLIVDSREPDFIKSKFPLATIQKLESGDFRYDSPEGKIILIERKTPQDLQSSIIDGRILRQIIGMKEMVGENGRCAILLDGTPNDPRYFHLVSSALLTAQDCGVAVFQRLGKIEEFVPFMIRKLLESDVKVTARRAVTMEKGSMSMLKSVPGVGHKTAAALLLKHGTLKAALESLFESEKEFFNGK